MCVLAVVAMAMTPVDLQEFKWTSFLQNKYVFNVITPDAHHKRKP